MNKCCCRRDPPKWLYNERTDGIPRDAFSTITVKNNWGYLEYYMDGKKFDSSVSGKGIALWPDGTTQEVMWLPTHICESVSDHGKAYTVSSYKLEVPVEYRGLTVLVPLEKVEGIYKPVFFNKED